MNGNLSAVRQNTPAWIHAGFITLGLLVVVPIVLFVLGQLLGRLTVAIARRSGSGNRYVADSSGWLGRQIYRVVILLSILYFYVSIPGLVFGILAGMLGSIYLELLPTTQSGTISDANALFWIGGIFIVVSFFPILIAMFFSQPRRGKPPRSLLREEAPLLWSVVEEVAKQVDTRPVDVIFISPDARMAVKEEGALIPRFRKPTQRQLLLGLGTLPGMTQGQFKAILAHEYGHFSNRDTAGGGWAYQVITSMGETMVALEEQALSTRFLPWFLLLFLIRFLVKSYYRYIFIPITIGATRLQEMMSDRFAAAAYGSANFASGLTHIVHQGLVFDTQLNQEEKEARKAKRRLRNLYLLPPLDAETEQKIVPLFEKAMTRPTSFYDTHPSPNERIRLIKALNTGEMSDGQSEPVWSLLPNAEALQMEMTGAIQFVLYSRYGHSWAK